MKNALLIIVLSLAYNLSVLNAQNLSINNLVPSSEVKALKLSWDKTVHDFGDIPQGTPVKAEFTLTNDSKDILLITEVKTSKGWLVIDSNHAWTSLDRESQPFSLAHIQADQEKEGHPGLHAGRPGVRCCPGRGNDGYCKESKPAGPCAGTGGV